jgi:hypothetical protein
MDMSKKSKKAKASALKTQALYSEFINRLEIQENLSGMDSGSQRTGRTIGDSLPQYSLSDLQIMSETSGTNRYPRFAPSEMHLKGTLLWSTKSVKPKNETLANPAVSSTSFARVEKEIAKCISECLSDVPSRKRNVHQILQYVVDYRVVRFHHSGTPKVSLHRVHLILQDNFPGSCFCRFCNIMLAGFMGVEPTNIEI